MKLKSFLGGLILLASCNFQHNNYHAVDPSISQFVAANTGSWWKFRDSLGTAVDTVRVTSLSNTFTPLSNGSDNELYQTIVMQMEHIPSLKYSKVVLTRDLETSTLSYTDTSGNTHLLLTEPSTSEPTILDSLVSGKHLYKKVLTINNFQQPGNTLYIAKGYWIVKYIIKSEQTTHSWILDTVMIK